MTMNSTSVKLGGDTSGVVATWVVVPSNEFLNGFSTQANNPLAYAVIEFLGQRHLLLRGTVVTPNPRPTVQTSVVPLGVAPAFGQFLYMNNFPTAPWGAVGRRAQFFVSSVGQLTWNPPGADVAGEVSYLDVGAVRLVWPSN